MGTRPFPIKTLRCGDSDGVGISVFFPVRKKCSGFGSSSNQNVKRRRGVRKWVVTSNTVVGDGVMGEHGIPSALRQLLEWLFRGIQEVSHKTGVPVTPSEPWEEWVRLPMEDLMALVMQHDHGAYGMLYSLIQHTLQILQSLQAHSTRTDTLQSLYTATIWQLKGSMMARAYLEHLLVPRFSACPVSGIPRVTGMTLHFDECKSEWYVSTT